MQTIVISLARAVGRRRRIKAQFESLGIRPIFHEALDGRQLTRDHYASVNREMRSRLGQPPQADGSIANWLSQREAMRRFLKSRRGMIAIFEDDAQLSPELPDVLDELERRPFAFDVVKLNRRNLKKPFFPCEELSTGHTVGRLRFSDYGSEGYVITRDAAEHFLRTVPKMTWEIDNAISYFWETGLNIFYINPPVVRHDERNDSQIEEGRLQTRRQHKVSNGHIPLAWRRSVGRWKREYTRWAAFRRLCRGEIGVTSWP